MMNFAPATTFVPYNGPTPISPLNRTVLPLSANPIRAQVYPPPAPDNFSDHIYATKYGVPLELRVWPANVTSAAPWVFWNHGGGWIAGRHYDPNPWLIQAFRPEGYHVVSASYRLAPEASLEDMYDDCKDAFNWAYANLPDIIGQGLVSRDNYFVGGESAGATLSLFNGHQFNPPPKAVLGLYSPADLELLGRPRDPLAPRTSPNLTSYSPAQVYEGAKSRNLSRAITVQPGLFELTYQGEELTRSLWRAPWIQFFDRNYFLRQVELYIGAVSGTLPIIMRYYETDSLADYTNYTRKLSPLEQVKVRKTYPPTYLMHGSQDPVVNITESYKFAAAVREIGVPVKEWYEDGSHVFDFKYRNGTASAGWSEFVRPVIDFMNQYVRK